MLFESRDEVVVEGRLTSQRVDSVRPIDRGHCWLNSRQRTVSNRMCVAELLLVETSVNEMPVSFPLDVFVLTRIIEVTENILGDGASGTVQQILGTRISNIMSVCALNELGLLRSAKVAIL